MAKVFISHSWNDNDISRKIAHELEKDGAEIWIDYARIKPGDTLPERINQALDWCDTLILVWSKSAAKSFWVKKEWQSMLTLQKEIIPCIINDTPLPAILCSVLYINFKDFAQGYDQLLRALDLEPSKPPVPPPEPQKTVRPKRTLAQPKVLKAASIFIAIIIVGLIGIYLVNRFSSSSEKKNPSEENFADPKSTEDSPKTYWDYRQSEMKSQYTMTLNLERSNNLTVDSKVQIWQQFLTNYADDNPYSQQDDDQRNYAIQRKNYWLTYTPLQPVPSTEKTVEGMKLVFISGGTFEMGDTFGDGDADEKPVHSVTVSDFYMGKTEVTNAQYAAFLNDYGKDKDDQGNTMIYEHDWGLRKSGNRWQAQSGYENHPVVYVTWYGAAQYAKWAGCRLPTEAEWEYAAREGGKKVRFGNGKNIADPAEINFDGRKEYKRDYSVVGVYRGKTTPVASFRPNALGLYDMSGNVWEWCWDWYDENYYKNSHQNNPRGSASSPIGARVLRGGSWDSHPRGARSADRDGVGPDGRDLSTGFRVVQDSPH